jgi:hypothetical protein
MILVKLKSDLDVQQTHLGAFTFLLTNKGGWEPSGFYSCIVMTKLYEAKFHCIKFITWSSLKQYCFIKKNLYIHRQHVNVNTKC